MSSDVDVNIRLKADQQLLEIDKKYTGFIQVIVVLSDLHTVFYKHIWR